VRGRPREAASTEAIAGDDDRDPQDEVQDEDGEDHVEGGLMIRRAERTRQWTIPAGLTPLTRLPIQNNGD
jgi:hypothetical protein